MQIRSDAGAALDASISVILESHAARLVFESRGPDRNPDYIPAFNLVLQRLASRDGMLIEAVVASARALTLPVEARRLDIDGMPFPISLRKVSDVDKLAGALRAAAAAVGRPAGQSQGGNPTKRVELTFQFPDIASWSRERLERLLEHGADEEAATWTPTGVADGATHAEDASAAAEWTYLLTWNPERFSLEEFRNELAAVERGELPFARWSCGNSKSVPAGARVFLLRQGTPPRGIVAAGWVIHPSHQALHWDAERCAAGESTWYVGVAYEALLSGESEPALDVAAVMDGPLSDVYWAIPASGTRISTVAAAALEERWNAHVGGLPMSAVNDPEISAVEGKIRERLIRHRSRERALRTAKLAATRAASPDGRLRCEVPACGFDFEARYGDVGAGFAHVHHLRPLATLDVPSMTTLVDLAVVCANCHAMIHRDGACRSLASLIAGE